VPAPFDFAQLAGVGAGATVESRGATIPLVQRKLETRPDWQIALSITVALRAFYSTVAAALSFALHPNPALIHSNAFTGNLPAGAGLHYAFLGIWERFDTLWYLHIAQQGYDLPASVVFYPLYPALIRILSPLIGSIASALLISTVAAFFLFWGMLRLVRDESGTPPFRALALVAVWPASFFFFAGYTESLATALVVWCIMFGRDERWGLASACAIAAGLTRSMGTLLIIPLVILAWNGRRASRWLVLLAPSGTLGYWAWLHWTGHLSVANAYRTFWNTEVAAPWTTLWHAVVELGRRPDALLVISLAFLMVFFFAGVLARQRIEERCFAAAVIAHILLRMCVPPLLGTPRYLLPTYPAYLAMGRWTEGLNCRNFVFLCAVLFAFNLAWMVAFLNWSLVL
jgi:hypothetical protein